ncbi:hypothetical protein LSCM1_02496 [Leishmania martiniquensis]|uniref:Uncharacterized protein n=1 Tax=Leishmania martiniquensis TaxID=1580590 RepID=A0A836KD10_9TRYP|nr:hypothetical protein LSCM1_02496 [Leishmania martiniquensis]
MPSTSRNAKQRIACLAGLMPICFYVALAIVCGLHRRWISVAFSIASAFTFSVLAALNVAAIIAVVVAPPRTKFAKRPNEAPCLTHLSSSAASAKSRTDLSAIDGNWNPTNAQRSEEDAILSSITESTMTNSTATVVGASSRLMDGSVRASVNPLLSVRHAARTVCAARQQSSQTPAEVDVAELEETYILSPPFAIANMCKKGAFPAICASPTSGPSGSKSSPAEQIVVERDTSKFYREKGRSLKEHTQRTSLLSTPLPDPACTPTDTRQVSLPPTVLFICLADPSRPTRTTFKILVLLYVTVTLSVVTLAGSVVLEYDTHCLFLACPALGVPWLWTHLVPLKKALDSTPAMSQSFYARMVRFLTHRLAMLSIWIASLGVFAAALTLEFVRWTPYSIGGEATPDAIRVVSYLAPIQMVVIMGVSFANLMEMRGASVHDNEGVLMVADQVPAAADFSGRLPAQRVSLVVAPGHKPPDQCDQPSSFAGSDRAVGPSSAPSGDAVPLAAAGAGEQCKMLPACFQQILSDDTCSTLSSIVRSSTGSSIFVPRVRSASSEALSVNRNHVQDSRSVGNGSAGHPGNSQLSAIMTSVPQLKTVTMLYVAYRDIFGEDNAVTSAPIASDEKRGIAANRKKQQTVSANFEALMEALEDARERGNADANAYMLTAYEDAICLVWGLIPFSSEPVLLAIEKARQIMEAFRSRPRPPPSFGSAQQELVAAVVSAPHSLVGLIGSGSNRGIHFFNASQHVLGAQILRRGLAMYRRLPSLQASHDEQEKLFHCILLDGRSWTSTASHVLARPCCLHCYKEPGASVKQPNQSLLPRDSSTKPASRQFFVIYDFLEVVQAKEEEWHLVVQRQEHLGLKYCFLSEAVQLLHQGNVNGARQVLEGAVHSTSSPDDADNITLALMMLEDLNRAEDEVPSAM